ncbi:maleylpyruvate isomerase family mycothiol-dependent enzyme [Brevibacterium aurantiacum]|uniref:maleylpyruvate isomerase family mycothiol-dependent enzyme n=1 Tax=Brevibacterium aurantiacum TaxID=273384 RepID=UPI000F65167D|nr:maleylpyruvate isomerase family mycothiol-dependent enzyme [Brevibacterium aurantiacum]AZL10479.1 hypothetical protein CXR26_15560 [Brevibacterium aurantiacum]
MEIFAAIADERRHLADQLADLTPEQQATQSLCEAWTVHDVLAHLTMPLDVSMSRFALAMLMAGGNFDRANRHLTQRQAALPFNDVINLLRDKADSRFTPPGEGPEAPLTDVIVYGLDIRWPLGLPDQLQDERADVALTAAMKAPASVVKKGVLDGLQFEATDMDWKHGSGPAVLGPTPALLLAITGRAEAVSSLNGDGVELLKHRLLT